ncbi:MAG: hypothetical protein SV186_05095 [Candidatus Nanohaloarchaea archaeon]|nr:hypothetical protein [Candidatus Nanohaloarchaea archaeon]
MDLDQLYGDGPDQTVETFRNKTRELDDGQVFAHKEAALIHAVENNLDAHKEALEEAYWEDIVQHAREDYVADRTAAKEALYWHNKHGLFDEYEVKDLCHNELDVKQAYSDLTDQIDDTGSLDNIENRAAYHVVQPAEVAHRAETTDDHVIEEVEAMQEQLETPYLDS